MLAKWEEGPAVDCTRNRRSPFGFRAYANHAFHPFGVGELLPDLFRENKALIWSSGHCIGQLRHQIASTTSRRKRMRGASHKGNE